MHVELGKETVLLCVPELGAVNDMSLHTKALFDLDQLFVV